MSCAPAAPPTTTTTDADMVDHEADELLGADRMVTADSESKESPAKRSRTVSSTSTMTAMIYSQALSWSVLTGTQ